MLEAAATDDLLTVSDVAEALQVNPQTVRNWIDRGELSALRIGGRRVRVQRSVLEAFLGMTSSAKLATPDRKAHVPRGTSTIDREATAAALDEVANALSTLASALRLDGR
jgi:excisionase family DNA binding protein